LESAKRLIHNLIETHGEKYSRGAEFLKRLDELEKNPNPQNLELLIREAALANPILDFDKILCIRRKPQKNRVGFTALNAYTEDTIPRHGWDNEIMILSNLRGKPNLTPVYKHPNNAIMRDLDLHFDAQKFLFASVNEHGNWAVFEIGLDGSLNGQRLRELTPNDQKDVQWFDPCYLAEDGVILSFSTAGMQGVPCVEGSQKVASLYRVDTNKNKVRQLTFEQDSGWHPRLLNDGRVMYLRWQYTETPHYFDRMLFTMSPDGRQQKALWGRRRVFSNRLQTCASGVDASEHGTRSCERASFAAGKGAIPQSFTSSIPRKSHFLSIYRYLFCISGRRIQFVASHGLAFQRHCLSRRQQRFFCNASSVASHSVLIIGQRSCIPFFL
jgi:hypothetical protein